MPPDVHMLCNMVSRRCKQLCSPHCLILVIAGSKAEILLKNLDLAQWHCGSHAPQAGVIDVVSHWLKKVKLAAGKDLQPIEQQVLTIFYPLVFCGTGNGYFTQFITDMPSHYTVHRSLSSPSSLAYLRIYCVYCVYVRSSICLSLSLALALTLCFHTYAKA